MEQGLQSVEQVSDGTERKSERDGLQVRTSVKGGPGSGGVWLNHSEAKPLKVRTAVKAGGPLLQHSEAKPLKVRTSVKAGGWSLNHSQARGLSVTKG